MGTQREIEEFADDFGVNGRQIVDGNKLGHILVLEERMVRVHRQMHWVAVGKTIFLKEVMDVLSLMDPQLPRGPVPLELNP